MPAFPRLTRSRYLVLVHGLVERPMVFTLADLKRFPGRSIPHPVPRVFGQWRPCCTGASRVSLPRSRRSKVDGLTSTSEWTGVPLVTLFREVGASPRPRWFLAEADGRGGV